jgi:hypothetical protein
VKFAGIHVRESVGNAECPVMIRSVIAVAGFSVRLHRFRAGYEDEHPHDHPWAFITVVLRGGYVDISAAGVRDVLTRGSVRYRRSSHTHRTSVAPSGATTLVLTGPLVRDWGFWIDGKLYPWRRYRQEFPPAPCAPPTPLSASDPPVSAKRLRNGHRRRFVDRSATS